MSVGGPPTDLILQAFAGLATTVAPDVRPGGMRPNQARLLRNLDCSDGDLAVRKGHKRQRVARVDGTRPIIQVFRALKGSDGTKRTLVQTRNKLWRLSASAVASISGSSLTVTSGYPMVMCSYQDTVYGVNGQNSFWSWAFTGKIAAASAVPAGGKYKGVFPFEEKLVHFRDSTTRSGLRWSDEGLPTTYQTLHQLFYPVDRSSELIGAWPLHSEIIMAAPERTGKTVGGLPPQAVIDIDTRRGSVSYYSGAEVDGWLYWVANGPTVVRTNGNIVEEVSRMLDLSDVDIGTERFLRGFGYLNRYYVLSYNSLATGAGGAPDRQLVYDTWRNEWYGPHQGNRLSSAAEFRAPGDDGRLLGGSPSGFAAIYYSGSADGGTKITGVYEGPVFRGPDPIHRMTVDEYGIMAAKMTSGTATVGAFFDRRGTASAIGTVNLKASGFHEGDRDRTTVTRTTIVGALKPNPRQAFFEYQPRLSIAQKSGRARVRTMWLRMRKVKEL